MDEQRLAGLQPPALEGVVPDGKEGLGDRGGRDEREARRHRQRMAFVRRTIFGVTAADHQRHDLVAELPSLHACAQRGHFARDLETWNVGRAGGGGYRPWRCITSGRLTPAAATFSSTSPSAGRGSGRCSGTSMSAPQGARIAIAVIWAGNEGMAKSPWLTRSTTLA